MIEMMFIAAARVAAVLLLARLVSHPEHLPGYRTHRVLCVAVTLLLAYALFLPLSI